MGITANGRMCGNGRSSHKFTYTYEDIADICHLRRETIWKYARNKRFDPTKLASVLDWIGTRRGRSTLRP
jgi:hypothetical protein